MRQEIKRTLDDTIKYLYHNQLASAAFPIEPRFIVNRLYKCRYISYARLAKESGKTINDIIDAFRSQDGCTHYDLRNDRYLISINETGRSKARIRWTIAHELGHISAGHFVELANQGIFEIPTDGYQFMEEEADYFAASLLAPLPAIKAAHIENPDEIRKLFGLSSIASNYRLSEYRLHSNEVSSTDAMFEKIVSRSVRRDRWNIPRKPIDVWPDAQQ